MESSRAASRTMITGRYRRWALALALVATATAAAAWWVWADAARQAASKARTEPLRCDFAGDAPGAPHPGMVWVPPGTLDFGDTVYPQEQPVRTTPVAGFWMDRTEVSNDDFAAFVKATAYVTVAERALDPKQHPQLPSDMLQPGAVVFVMPNAAGGQGDVAQWWRYTPGASWRHPGGPQTSIEGRGAFPVVAVTFEDAQAYARWKGRSLPGEAQWEWAARGGSTAIDHVQPKSANTWQGLFPVVNSGEDGFIGVAPTGCYAPNAYGLHDMIGNVWELTADRWTEDHAQPAGGVAPLVGAQSAPQRVIKGGSFLCAPNYCMRYRAGARQAQDEDLAASHLGFRTILNAPGP